MMKKLLLYIGIFFMAACSRYQPYVNPAIRSQDLSEEKPLYSIYFTGDFKEPDPQNQNMRLISGVADKESSNSAFVLLGNLIYPKGLPDDEDRHFGEAAGHLRNVLNPFRGYEGKLIVAPGNRDWANGGSDGAKRARNLETFVEEYLDRGNIFLPDDACPGPAEVALNDDITLIVFNSQWWLQKSDKYAGDFDCDFDDMETEEDYRREILLRIRDALERNKDRHVIFATHHPLESAGRHGGHFPAEENLFPLLPVNPWLWIPLPGFIYTGSRAWLGEIQDEVHPEYKQMRRSLEEIIKNYPNAIYLSAHDQNLQYKDLQGIHHLVSGAATNADYVARRSITGFSMQSAGLGKISFYPDGGAWLEFIVPNEDNQEGRVVFSKQLYRKESVETKQPVAEDIPDYTDSTVTRAASLQYDVGNFTRWLMGENYREVWNQPVEFRVFDIGKEKGGLEIVKRGGGQQTKSVRLEAEDGRQYVLRSVEKYVEGALPHELWGTVAVDVVQDGISQSHPYAAMAVAELADHAGVYHTNPEIVFVPDDPRLGIYRKEMAGRLFLFEERPDGDRRDVQSFGSPEDIESTSKVLKETQNHHDEYVDQQAVLRARLFDMVISDWDRHEDQWRWAEFEEEDDKIYRPIPRDRDNAFFIAEGPVQWVVKRKWLQPKFQGFDEETKNIAGFNFNARYFDRTFLNKTTREDWRREAEKMQHDLTDEKIESAIREGLPPEIFDISGEAIIRTLKARRDRLVEFAEEYYLFLAKTVDITGTDDRDLFLIERLDDSRTKVTGRELSQKKGKIKGVFYSRIFYGDETKEIRIFGLKDEDRFELTGDVESGIKVRIIGGKGTDTIIDNSRVKGLARKTLVYDRPKSTFLQAGPDTKNLISKAKGINDYDREQFKYNKVIPQAYMGYSLDDGIFIGGGALIKTYNFRDSTYQRILGNFAYQTAAFNIRYSAIFSSFFRRFDLVLDGMVSAPNVVNNFFGFGNETPKITDDKDYYRVRYHYGYFSPMARKSWEDELELLAGPFFIFGKVEDTENRFITDFLQNGLSEEIFMDQYYAGLNARMVYDTRDDKDFPRRGLLWSTEAQYHEGLNNFTGDFTSLESDLRLYLSFRKDPRMIFALRFGGGKNWGNYPFYFAQSLGGKSNLRGFRANRFSGDAAMYQNTDVRLKLFNLNTYVITGQLGILGFNDVGRVWYNGENPKKWHHGYGAGLWLTPYNKLTLMLNYNMSEEEHYFDFHFSYLF